MLEDRKLHVNDLMSVSLRTADAFPAVASLPPKNREKGGPSGREATTGNASAGRRLDVCESVVMSLFHPCAWRTVA